MRQCVRARRPRPQAIPPLLPAEVQLFRTAICAPVSRRSRCGTWRRSSWEQTAGALLS